MSETSSEEIAALAMRELQQELSTVDGERCFLLTDPTLRPVDADEPPWQHFAGLTHTAVPVAHRNVDSTNYPILTTLRPRVKADAALLAHTVQESCAELAPESLQRGQGRRIGGWIVSRAPVDDVALHLGQTMIQRHPTGHDVWLRLQDPAVLWLVWAWLPPAQRATLLGPIDRFYLLDPLGEMVRLTTEEAVFGTTLDLSRSQWAAIDCIEPLNIALRKWSGPRSSDQLRPARIDALAAIQRAKKLGFGDARDLAFYGFCALSVHARFDFHPAVLDRLRARKAGDFFGGLVADLGPQDWRRIAQEATRLEGA